MRLSSFSALLVGLTACGGASQPDAGIVEDAGVEDAGVGDAGVVRMDFGTGRKILAYLEGKTMVMTGPDIPSSPNGLSEAFDLGANTQCYRAITLRMTEGAFTSTVERGRLVPPADGGAAFCDHTVTTGTAMYNSKAVLVDNVQDNGQCFDITIDYTTFGEEGRGTMSPDGGSVTLELYYRGKATQHRCEDGPVGAPTVHLLVGGAPVPFSGDSLEVYRLP